MLWHLLIFLDGGPVAWGDGQSKVIERVQLANEDALKMVFVSREGTRRTFDVTCLDVHEQDVTVVLRHTFSTPGYSDTIVSVTRKVSCQMPQSLKIVPLNSNTMAELTPESTHTMRRYTVRNNQTVPVKLSIFDINGDKFLSFYSVHVSWQLLNAVCLLFFFTYLLHSILLNYAKPTSTTLFMLI